MRTFKFRVCVKSQDDSKLIIYSGDVDSERHMIGLNGGLFENYGKSWREPFWESVFDSVCEIQQFTGLYDVNKKEIYEGDIVKFTPFGVESNTNDYLQFNNGIKKIAWGLGFGDYPTASFVAISIDPADLETGVALNVMMQPYMEVIGNIFENKN